MVICNRVHERLANSGKIATSTGVPLFDALPHVFLNLENRDLNRRNLRSMMKLSYAASPCLSQLILTQLALEICLAARNLQKIHKTPILAFKVIQGH